MMHIMPWTRTDTRERMVTSAALLLRERGVAGTSFARVLEHSGAPRGSLGHHFPGGKRELLADAVRQAGGAAAAAMRRSAERGDPPARLFSGMCAFYRRALVDSDFAAGCPVGAVAEEAYDDEDLRGVVGEVFGQWRTILADALIAHGHRRRDANDLAELCIASLEGALVLARVQQSPDPIDRIERRLRAVLAEPPIAGRSAAKSLE
jgi:TetR/AcrR family transcriptional regulator, lmrAB and yxaGH operons repressor